MHLTITLDYIYSVYLDFDDFKFHGKFIATQEWK